MPSLIAYATLMDPDISADYGLYNPKRVYVHHFQRFYGLLDIFEKNADEFENGKHAVSTITYDPLRFFNGVLYEVSEDDLERINDIESSSGLERIAIQGKNVLEYPNNFPLAVDGPIYSYKAKETINIDGREINLLRKDLTPNQHYLERVMNASEKHGVNFSADYLITTFYADRKHNLVPIQSFK